MSMVSKTLLSKNDLLQASLNESTDKLAAKEQEVSELQKRNNELELKVSTFEKMGVDLEKELLSVAS